MQLERDLHYLGSCRVESHERDLFPAFAPQTRPFLFPFPRLSASANSLVSSHFLKIHEDRNSRRRARQEVDLIIDPQRGSTIKVLQASLTARDFAGALSYRVLQRILLLPIVRNCN